MKQIYTIDGIEAKRCNGECGEIKVAADFHVDIGGVLGVKRICKKCCKPIGVAYYAENKEHMQITLKEWRGNNKERIAASDKAYSEAQKPDKPYTYNGLDTRDIPRYHGSSTIGIAEKASKLLYELGLRLVLCLTDLEDDDRFKAEQLGIDLYKETITNQKRAYPNNTKYHEWLANLPSYINKQLTEAELNVVLNS